MEAGVAPDNLYNIPGGRIPVFQIPEFEQNAEIRNFAGIPVPGIENIFKRRITEQAVPERADLLRGFRDHPLACVIFVDQVIDFKGIVFLL